MLLKHARVLVFDNSGLAASPPVHPDVREHTLALDRPGVYPPTVRAPPVADGEGARLMRAHLDKYVASGVLELAPAGTPAYARAFMVWNGRKWRLVTALQDVNRYTRFDGPPLRDLLTRDIRQSSTAHAGMTCFSSGDVLEAFTVVRNDEFTARICALATPFGVFFARRMLFGGTYSAELFHSIFQRFLERARGDTGADLLSLSQFIDDMLTGCRPDDAASWDAHFSFWDALLTALYDAGFRLKLSKCRFLQHVGEFCGALIDGKTVRVDLSRFKDLETLAPPPTASALNRAIGFFNYFAANIPASVYGPPMRVLMSASKFTHKDYAAACSGEGGGTVGRAFTALKAAVIEHSTLAMPDPAAPLYIVTDACDHFGHGGAIIQFDSTSGSPRAVAYWSKQWSAAQERWSAGRKEMYAQYHGVTSVMPRYMSHFPTVILLTDANNLSSVRRVGGNLASEDVLISRWAFSMLQYPHYFNYAWRIPGRVNFVGDTASRQHECTHSEADVSARITAAIDAAEARARDGATQLRAIRGAAAPGGTGVPKRGPGRPRKAPHDASVPASTTSAPPPAPDGTGAPKRGPGRPRKPASDATQHLGPMAHGVGTGARTPPLGEPLIPGHLRAAPLIERIVGDQRLASEVLATYCAEGAAGSRSGFTRSALGSLGDVVFYRGRLYVHSAASRAETMHLAHDADGHPGRDRLLERLHKQLRVGWPGIDTDVGIYLRSCTDCQISKTRSAVNHLDSGTSSPSVPAFPDHTWHADPFGPFDGWSFFVVIDAFTHFVWLVPSRGTDSSQCIDALAAVAVGVGHWPLNLRVDGARALNSREIREFLEARHCTVLESPGHSQFTLGMAENRVKQFKAQGRVAGDDSLRELCANNASEAVVRAACEALALAHNHSLCRTIGTTPMQARYGNPKPPPLELISGAFAHIPRPSEWPLEVEAYANRLSALQTCVSVSATLAKLSDAKAKDSVRAPAEEYKDGDFVLQKLPLSLDSTKPSYRGPLRVLGQSGPRNGSWYNVCKLENYERRLAPFAVHVSALKRFDASRTTVDQLLSRGLNGDFGIVSAITHHRLPAVAGGEVEFLVTFEGSPLPVYTLGSSLNRVTIFTDYVHAHKLDPSQFNLNSDWTTRRARTGGRR